MVSEACCNRDRTQAVFPDPVIPTIMEVKGCSKRNRWHFCENIGTVWNGVRPALQCLDITCLCILSFLLKDFCRRQNKTNSCQLLRSKMETENKLECWAFIQVFIVFPPPPPPHFYRFPCSSSSFLLFSLLLLISFAFPSSSSSFLLFFPPSPPPPPHSIVFYPSPTRFIFFLHEIL